jgi:hypothetical protein
MDMDACIEDYRGWIKPPPAPFLGEAQVPVERVLVPECREGAIRAISG